MEKNRGFVLIFLGAVLLMVVAQLFKITLLYGVGAPLTLVSISFLGLAKKGSIKGSMGMFLALLFVLILQIVCMIIMIQMHQNPGSITKSFVLGFPLPTFLLFFVFWFFSGIFSSIIYALRMDKEIISDESIKEFEEKTGVNLAVKS